MTVCLCPADGWDPNGFDGHTACHKQHSEVPSQSTLLYAFDDEEEGLWSGTDTDGDVDVERWGGGQEGGDRRKGSGLLSQGTRVACGEVLSQKCSEHSRFWRDASSSSHGFIAP